MRLAHCAVALGSSAVVATMPACFSGDSASAGPVTVHVVVVDAKTNAPLPFAVVAVERGGLYLALTDYAKPNPAYVFGAVAGADGRFDLALPGGKSGLHAFASDYLYRGLAFDSQRDSLAVTIAVEPRLPQLIKPTMTNAALDPATAAPSATITVHADLAAGTNDAISDEVILVDPKTNFATALAPPSAGRDRDHYPDGKYQTTFVAPSTPGTYGYVLVATTGQCANADTVALQLVVR